jgi:IS5 family transposase
MAFQDSILSLAISDKKIVRSEAFLSEMNEVIPWNTFIEILTPYYEVSGKTGKDSSTGGRPRRGLLLMLKMYFLSQWYGLSDEATEEAIYDRLSFQKFLDINLVTLSVPDATTLENFRHMLEKDNLTEVLFSHMNTLLENHGLLLKRGTSVDATIITAPSSTKNEKKERDPEMKSTKKGANYSF